MWGVVFTACVVFLFLFDHLHQTPQGPQDKTSTLKPPQSSDKAIRHSSSPSSTRLAGHGSLKKYEERQDTGSGVHPYLNISHYVNPRGVGITKTISRAELPAIAAAIIHGYSHIATDSRTPLHQIKNSSHTQTSSATTFREMSSNPLPK